MIIPASTYRIQFHKEFTFKDFEEILPYLHKLGVDTIYASPIFKAFPGSTHGYDVICPLEINPEIGTEKELLDLSARLKKLKMNWIQDIVPNHMAFHPNNSWLMDVLKNGQKSIYSSYFDIDFKSGDGKIMVPFLGKSLQEAIEDKSIQIKTRDKDFYIASGDDYWPVNMATARALSKSNLTTINTSAESILRIAESQHYRLCNWQETNERINYRRFFTVNSLICLNIQHPDVFEHYHRYILALCKQCVFQGLRIDHIDGLFDVEAYLKRLRTEVGKDAYIVVEKILELGEELPETWPVAGTTGYEFLAQLNNLFTNRDAEKTLDDTYAKFTGKQHVPEVLMEEKKRAILTKSMQGELENLCKLFYDLNLDEGLSFDRDAFKAAIAEMLIAMPVYRYYAYDFPMEGENLEQLKSLIAGLKATKEHANAADILNEVFITRPSTSDKKINQHLSAFYQRCMQFSGPLMAKGVEDTLMFTYNRFTGHNEVGDSPLHFGTDVAAFHKLMQQRLKTWPHSQSASTTHDTKRGEDFRARLNVLSDVPKAWSAFVMDLKTVMEQDKKSFPTLTTVHPNDLYLLIQTLVGALPYEDFEAETFASRMDAFLEKAVREAKKRSDWASPDEEYEQALQALSKAMLDPENTIYSKIRAFIKEIQDYAILNSLAQLLIKCTAPGVPDFYQGSECWDLSLVDPDNRRPVDYESRISVFESINETMPIASLWAERATGKAKIGLSSRLLNIRKKYPKVFSQGDYIPLKTTGKYAAQLFAFARKWKNNWIITAVPLGLAKLAETSEFKAEDFDWSDTQIILPAGAPLGWTDLLNGTDGHKDILNEGILAAQLFKKLPLAMLNLVDRQPARAAGVLLHISSLNTDFGIGDMGSSARDFVDFLQKAKQCYWQILPLNPTKSANGNSPYSSASAMAGNVLLINPSMLGEAGLLSKEDLEAAKISRAGDVDFDGSEKTKSALLKKAFKAFDKAANSDLKIEFKTFLKEEHHWLPDYALYAAIKNHQQGQEWINWEHDYKFKDKAALTKFKKDYAKEIEEICWQQFIFYKQWLELKSYANEKGIHIIGDLPFYVDEDSVEVWTNPQHFLLDNDLNKLQMAGVPPDYFNASGQLWGMPIFDWAALKKDNYQWWVNRLKQNLKLYDLLRLDHFRAFAAYWQVPAGSKDATSGEWVKGPGTAFFEILEKELGELPFIAEDLGESAPEVEALMDDFNLPGMKVLQFAFSEQLPSSPHAPHNFSSSNTIVYSGTHDNNTVKGWFDKEADENMHNRISDYTGIKVSESNINQVMIRLCYSSVAKLAILPIQDILALDEKARMNVPGTGTGNWDWRLQQNALNESISKALALEAERYGRV
ncbi:malto-oligosyltrehalose synthase [Pedobacter sp. Leaf132]|uniref:malto-oligosyltrehalose synthase n=1 Tax=Pedobacter sp. Leaf132 TaxID=2876557 RepID=UPI001E2CA00D|nr:malto-oligosyltrehalose synthase [Pedobacter sp. Leaf132]